MSQLYVDNIRNRTGGPIGIPTGAVVTGVLTATTGNITGNMTVGGVLTYEDVTNVDSVGVITAQIWYQSLVHQVKVSDLMVQMFITMVWMKLNWCYFWCKCFWWMFCHSSNINFGDGLLALLRSLSNWIISLTPGYMVVVNLTK